MKFLKKNKLKSISCAAIALLASPMVLATPPKVLTTIKPLQLLSQGITEGVTDTDVLLPAGASPHSHSLRPSDARKLHSADVIFWIGPDMESFLPRVLPDSEKVKIQAMMDVKNIKLIKNDSQKAEVHEHHGHHHHDHGDYDPHLWLSTDNGRVMAKAIAETLSDMDKANASHYQANLEKLLEKLDETDIRNQKQLADISHHPFFVFHDAYGYLQDQYDLNVAGHFTVNPEQQPGARHLSTLRNQLKDSGKTCIFREPQFQPAYIDRITEGLPVKVGELDPLAENIQVTPNGFPEFINSLVDNIQLCLR